MSTDETMALADLYYHNPYRDGSHTHLVYADQKRAALLKAVEALAVDAARYRRLRDSDNFEPGWWSGNADWYDLDDLDAAIDSAMQKATP